MGNPLKFEDSDTTFLITTRTMNSRMWFLNNTRLQQKILAYLARCQETYGAILYAFVLMANHYHLIARFPRCNKAAFMRDFNSLVAKLVASEVANFPGGRLWARRYSDQVLPRDFDITHWFLYVVLNPLTSKVCTRMSEFTGYSSLADCMGGRSLKFKVFERWKYNEARRYRENVAADGFVREYRLVFSKLPEFQHLTISEYRARIKEKIEKREEEILHRTLARPANHSDFEARQPEVGARPLKTKVDRRYYGRPLVLSLCSRARHEFLEFYFKLRERYRTASRALRHGENEVYFPRGTYRPIVLAT